MAKRTFFARAAWEEKAGALFSESDIIGHHIEEPVAA